MSVLAPVRSRTTFAAREWLRLVSRILATPMRAMSAEGFVARRHRIDAQVALAVANQVAVEQVPVRFGKPPPGKNIADDFVHGAASCQRSFVAPWA
jgi:hypothetical protein